MLKRLYKYSEGYKRETYLASILVVLEIFFDVLIPYIIARLIDDGVTGGSVRLVHIYGALIIAASVVSLVFGAFSAKCAGKASAGFAANLRAAMYEKILHFSYRDIDEFSASSIVTRMTTDTNNLRNSYLMLVRIAFRAPSMFIFSVAMVIAVGGKIVLIYCVLIPLLVAVVLSLMKATREKYKKVYAAYDKINLKIAENLRGIRVVKSFAAEDRESKKFEESTQEVYDNFTSAEKLLAFSFPFMQITVNTSLIIISWIASHWIVAGTFTPGELTSLISYSMQIFMSARLFITVSSSIAQSQETARRCLELIDHEVEDKSNGDSFDEKNYDLKFDDVSFNYFAYKDATDSSNAISNVSFDIKSGETIGVIGPTGCGKSTLALLMANLYEATDGKVTLGGKDINGISSTDLRHNVVVVLQQSILFSGTVRDNLVNGLSKAEQGEDLDERIKTALTLAKAEFVYELEGGLDYDLSQSGTNLSGGQRQRICIARALLRNPKIIIFDDSTSAIDAMTEKAIRENLHKSLPDATKIFISQRIASVKGCDRIIVLDNGTVDAIGESKELLNTSKVYADIYSTQIGGAAI